ncbi:MAG: DUF3828 domain-containing protein [Thermoflexales bacterium]|nr:DUF3828 domain-containing protein [Thermoflexales bacterium]
MNIKRFSLLVLSIVSILAASGCASAPSEAAAPPTSTPSLGIDDPSGKSPEQVTEAFYNWYIRYASPAAGRNPLVDGAYKRTAYMTDRLVTSIEQTLASFDKGGYDPILCAQDIPQNISVSRASVAGASASLTLNTSFSGHSFQVNLAQVEGQWKLDEIVCRPPQTASKSDPEMIVESFYAWYLNYSGDRANPRNPLVDGAYRSSEHLTLGLVQKVDGIVASFDKGGFDPFLCAQDIPERISLDKAIISGDVARVVVHTSFEGHAFTVALQQVAGVWKMSDVLCEAEQASAGELPQPVRSARQALAQRLNAGLEAVTVASVEQVMWRDGCLEIHQAGQACAQVITPGYRVILESGGQRYEYRTDESGSHVQAVDGAPTPSEATPGWQSYANDEYGFQLHYPDGWTYKEARSEPDQPPIGPANVKLIVMFMPQAWADEMNKGGPPDPNAPGIAPFALEVSVGTLQDYQQAYTPAARSENVAVNGKTLVREQDVISDELSMFRYRFESSSHPDLRLTFLDPISGFPDRRQGNEHTLELFEGMLASLTFIP